MKYTVETEINLPIARVIEIFDNHDNYKYWMDELQSISLISGEYSEAGTISELIFKVGRQQIKMTETITVRNLPHEITMTYKAPAVFNIVKNYFVSPDDNRTIYITEQEFQFTGFMKLIGFLMPGTFRKESLKQLNRFKDFAESFTG